MPQTMAKAAAVFAIVSAVMLGLPMANVVSAEENREMMVLEEGEEPLVADTDLISDWPEIPDHIFRPKDPDEEGDTEESGDEETVDPDIEDVVETEIPDEKMEAQEPTEGEGSVEMIPETGLEGEEGEEGLFVEMSPEEAEDPGKGFLLDQNWNEIRFSELEGKIVFVTFFYSECRYSHCTYLNNKMKFISSKFVEEFGRDLVLASISFDPAIDTVENLKIYSAKWEPDPTRWAFLTGDEADIKRVAKKFGIIFRWNDGDQSYKHSVRTFLVDREGKIVRTYRGMYYKHQDAIKDIKTLLKGKKLPPQEDFLVPTEANHEKEQEETEKANELKAAKKKKKSRKKR